MFTDIEKLLISRKYSGFIFRINIINFDTWATLRGRYELRPIDRLIINLCLRSCNESSEEMRDKNTETALAAIGLQQRRELSHMESHGLHHFPAK